MWWGLLPPLPSPPLPACMEIWVKVYTGPGVVRFYWYYVTLATKSFFCPPHHAAWECYSSRESPWTLTLWRNLGSHHLLCLSWSHNSADHPGRMAGLSHLSKWDHNWVLYQQKGCQVPQKGGEGKGLISYYTVYTWSTATA